VPGLDYTVTWDDIEVDGDEEQGDVVSSLLELANRVHCLVAGRRLQDPAGAAVMQPKVTLDEVQDLWLVVDREDPGLGLLDPDGLEARGRVADVDRLELDVGHALDRAEAGHDEADRGTGHDVVEQRNEPDREHDQDAAARHEREARDVLPVDDAETDVDQDAAQRKARGRPQPSGHAASAAYG